MNSRLVTRFAIGLSAALLVVAVVLRIYRGRRTHTAPAGRIDLVSPDRFDPVGRIAFAGSDMARQHAGWFEGALVSGAAAAAHVRGRY